MKTYEAQTNDFYIKFAEKYKNVFTNWRQSVENQGITIKNILNQYLQEQPASILDCTCGIGTQAIALSLLNYNLFASDICESEIKIAKYEAQKLNLNIKFFVADCRYLNKRFKNQKFPVIISMDNSLPHLLTKNDMTRAFQSICSQLTIDGLFISSFRDYDKLLIEKPRQANPIRVHDVDQNIRIINLKIWDWFNDKVKTTQYLIEDMSGNITVTKGIFYSWAITKEQIEQIALNSGFKYIKWLCPEETGYFEPILLLKNSD